MAKASTGKPSQSGLPKKALMAATARPGAIQKNIVADKFSLELYQDLTNPPHSDSLRIVAYDKNGKVYRLAPATLTDLNVATVAAAVLTRIANKKLKSGWTFDGIFYPSSQSGTITG